MKKIESMYAFVAEAEITGTSQRDNEPMSYDIEVKKIALLKGGA